MARKRAAATDQTEEIAAEEQAGPSESAHEGQREYPPEPNPRSWIHHNQAGVKYLTYKDKEAGRYESQLGFNEKPSPQVLAFIKENGFRWNRDEKVWTRPIGYATQAQDRLVGERTYHGAVDMMLEEKGLEPDSGHGQTPF